MRPVVCFQANQKSKPNKDEDHELERRDPLCADIPEWLQEFRENLVDDSVPEHRDSHASSSHELSLEPTSTRSEDLGKHSVYTHFNESVLISQLQGHLQDRRVIVLHLLQARLRHRQQHQVIMRLEKERIELKVMLSSACVN